MWFVVCFVIAIVGLAWWIWSRLSGYGRLFSDRHFAQIAQGIAALKQAALRGMATSDEGDVVTPDDARILRTSEGLAIVYTMSVKAPGAYLHHVSVSIPGRVTTHAVGDTFVLFWAKLLGVSYGRLALGVSPATVHHAEFVLNEKEQADFVQRTVEAPTAEWLKAFRAECLMARESLRGAASPDISHQKGASIFVVRHPGGNAILAQTGGP